MTQQPVFLIGQTVAYEGDLSDLGTVIDTVRVVARVTGNRPGGFNTGVSNGSTEAIRYVVRWADGSEDRFFESELTLVP